jgi:dynactin complex subunit
LNLFNTNGFWLTTYSTHACVMLTQLAPLAKSIFWRCRNGMSSIERYLFSRLVMALESKQKVIDELSVENESQKKEIDELKAKLAELDSHVDDAKDVQEDNKNVEQTDTKEVSAEDDKAAVVQDEKKVSASKSKK